MPNKQWKFNNVYLLSYDDYYYNQVEMPFVDLNTKVENRPTIGLLPDPCTKRMSQKVVIFGL